MRIIEDTKLDFSDVLIRPLRSELASRKDVKLERTFKTRHNNEITGIPIIAANMATGNFVMAEKLIEHNMFTAIAKHYNHIWLEMAESGNRSRLAPDEFEKRDKDREKIKRYVQNCFYTIGMCDEELEQLIKFTKAVEPIGWCNNYYDCIKICVDIANGYSQKFADWIRKIRETFPNLVIMAGNVCTPEMTQELILAGADIVKIGIGPGSVCTTRKVTGVGYPQLSACIENSDVAHGLGALICLDGGMQVPGDIAKAFGANADFVMLGGMFAGTDECDGEIITKYEHDGTYEKYEIKNYKMNLDINDKSPLISNEPSMYGYKSNIIEKKYKVFYGMSSDKSAKAHFGGIKEYRASEGQIEDILCKGPVDIVIRNILGGLRSACTYVGAKELKNMGKCTSFIKVHKQHNKF